MSSSTGGGYILLLRNLFAVKLVLPPNAKDGEPDATLHESIGLTFGQAESKSA